MYQCCCGCCGTLPQRCGGKAVAATGGVLRNTTRNSKETWRMGPVGEMVSEIKLMATRPRWTDRQAYTCSCALVGVVDASVVIEELLPLMLMASEDAVPNVRRSLARRSQIWRTPGVRLIARLERRGGALRNDHDADVAQTGVDARLCVRLARTRRWAGFRFHRLTFAVTIDAMRVVRCNDTGNECFRGSRAPYH